MYRIAIIQNESEMMRFGWADVRPSLQRFDYRIDHYTSENIQLLFETIDEGAYDALFITTNSCNNPRTLSALREHRETSMKHLLEMGKGIYIGYQAKMGRSVPFGFLPEPYDISAEIRNRATESTSNGELRIIETEAQHPILTFPKQIDVETITQQCLHNNLVEGIYWAYLLPCTQGIYQPLIVDINYGLERNILVTSRTDLSPRIVLSTLVAEWQGHDALWENIVRFVVEGRPSLAIVSKQRTASTSFKYLTAAVEIKKFASARYEFRKLEELTRLPVGPHDALILDPAWNEREIQDYVEKYRLVSRPGFSRVFYFGTSPRGEIIVNTISAFKDFDRISKNALTWLLSQGGNNDKPYWGGSFWTTFDVLATLIDFKYPITQYESILKPEIEKHDIDGRYDEVVGTTCALLEIYYHLYGVKNEHYRKTLRWIRGHFSNKTLYERATALDTLVRLGEEVEKHVLVNFKNEAVSGFSSHAVTNEFALQRFIRTLLTCGLVEDAESLALRLQALQDVAGGSWINIPNTASTVLALINLQNASKNRNPIIDDMLFKGVQFIKSSYSESKFSWDGDPLATAVSLRALKAFESEISFPVDEILVSLESVNREARSMIAIDTATKINFDLQGQINQLRAESEGQIQHLAERVAKESQDGKFAKTLSLWASGFSLAVISLAVLLVGYLIRYQKSSEFLTILNDFFVNTYLLIIPALSLIPLIAIVLLLNRFARLPKWLKALIEIMGKVK